MSRSYTLDGQSGTIPYDEYLRKIERYDMDEDPMLYENHVRSELADFRPDAPFFESDQARNPSDLGGGNKSRERLNLRHCGARSEEDPRLPDGTFLDHEFTERDPRGILTGPDMTKDREQRLARASFLKMYNDDDYTITESGINPVQMNSLIRGSQHQYKDRYQNFDESMDSWHNGGGILDKRNSNIVLVTRDGTIVDLAEATARNRQDPVNALSNSIPGLRRFTEPDHRVKISRYGSVRPSMKIAANDWNNNRSNTYLDHQKPIDLGGQMVNKMVALLIKDLEGNRNVQQMAARGTDYGDSEQNQNKRTRAINPEDLFKLTMIGMKSASHAESSHLQLNGDQTNKFLNHNNYNRDMLNASKVSIHHDLINSIARSNKVESNQHAKDIRDKVKKSSMDNGIYIDITNRRAPNVKVGDLRRESKDTRNILDNKTTKNYSKVVPKNTYNIYNKTDTENYKTQSRQTVQVQKNQTIRKNMQKSDTENDVDMSEFRDPDRREMIDAKASYSGRKVQTDFGDGDQAESYGGRVDMKNVLNSMI
jgi:hypothetical protein